MTNKEKIEEFMKQIDPNWDDLKKLRFICVQLCQLYNYDPRYAYATEDEKSEYMNNLQSKLLSNNPEEIDAAINYDDDRKICVSLFEIYMRLVRQLGISEEKYTVLGNAIYYTGDDGETYAIQPVKEMFCVKIKAQPQGFNKLYGSQDNEIDQRVMQIDKEIGLIDETGYTEEASLIEAQVPQDEMELAEKVEAVLEKGTQYLESTLGVQINNVEFHKFYKHLLRTSFPSSQCIVKPLSNEQLDNIEYVILARLTADVNECVCFLYDKTDKRFHRKSLEEIKTMINDLGLIDIGNNNVGCIDEMCDAGR